MPGALPLLRLEDLAADGVSSRAVRRRVEDSTLVRIRPGLYLDGTIWRAATPEQQVVFRATALATMSQARPVFSHETAAACHGLPLLRADPRRVHAIVSDTRPGAASGVVRHRGELGGDDIVEINGLLCTSLVRTVADVARTATFEQSVTIIDAALRARCARRMDAYDQHAASEFRTAAEEIARRSAHGLSRAVRALAFADGRAQLPGESISRIRLFELGFRDIRLQVRIPGPGRTFFVDFGLEEVRAFGEFDGVAKYVDGTLLGGRTTSQVFDEEKQREDWIRGHTHRRFARWGWSHIRTAALLGQRLADFGIRPPS